jgi:pimeloyl-ACP methyl ester carboxylesterase
LLSAIVKPSSSGPPTISDFRHIEFNNIPARHDWGGYVAITAATLHPNVFRRVAVLCVPHMRAFKLLPLMQLVRSWYVFLSTSSKDTPNTPFRYVFLFQIPFLPYRLLPTWNFVFIDLLYRTWSPGSSFCESAFVLAFRHFRSPAFQNSLATREGNTISPRMHPRRHQVLHWIA